MSAEFSVYGEMSYLTGQFWVVGAAEDYCDLASFGNELLL